MNKRWVIFDEKKSLLHSLLGMIIRLGTMEGLIGKVCSVVAFTGFIAYELIEVEDEIVTLGDIMETLIGYVLTDIVLT